MADTFTYDVFPEDLSSDYYGHWMTITAYQGNGNPTGSAHFWGSFTPVYSAGIFIPGGAGDSGIFYMDKHEYTDIKLSNLMGGALGVAGAGIAGAFGFNPATGASAGQAVGGVINKAAAYAGHPINPGVEVLYRSTNLRSFQFSFLMAPASEKESESMKSIIKNLRKYAAPKLDGFSNGMTFTSPSEFVIKFFHKSAENDKIPKIRRCVLTDIVTNFTPSGEWSTFTNGHPVSCMLSLEFQEMEIIHRDFIESGY